MKVMISYRPDKSVLVTTPAIKSKRLNETEEQWLDRVFEKARSPQYDKKGNQVNMIYGLPYDIVEHTELPQTREDREGWEGEKGKGITINAEKSKAYKDHCLILKEVKNIVYELAKKKLKENGTIN